MKNGIHIGYLRDKTLYLNQTYLHESFEISIKVLIPGMEQFRENKGSRDENLYGFAWPLW